MISSIVLGLQFGDEGKGAMVNRLCSPQSPLPSVDAVVRFNGGPQAAHNVQLNPGSPNRNRLFTHTFSNFNSGSYFGIPTWFTKDFLLDPWCIYYEASLLSEKLNVSIANLMARLHFSCDSPIVLPMYKYINRAQEYLRGNRKHGSCGMGIGVTAELVSQGNHITLYDMSKAMAYQNPRLKVLNHWNEASDKLNELLIQLKAEPSTTVSNALIIDIEAWLNSVDFDAWFGWFKEYFYYSVRDRIYTDEQFLELLFRKNHVLFEGAQGVLLDEWRGFHPYTTWSSTNLRNIHRIFSEVGYDSEYHTYGLTRAFTTRHGAGPFPTAYDHDKYSLLLGENNQFNPHQENFRVGTLDIPLIRYALNVAADPGSAYRGVDSLIVSHYDRVVATRRQHDVPLFNVSYKHDRSEILDIPVNPNLYDLETQEQITSFLFQATPGTTISSTDLSTNYVFVGSQKSRPIPIPRNQFLPIVNQYKEAFDVVLGDKSIPITHVNCVKTFKLKLGTIKTVFNSSLPVYQP